MSKLLDELRNNPRLRWGVLAIVGTCWLYGVLMLGDAQQLQLRRLQADTQNLARLRATLAQPEWLQRVAPAKTMAVQLEGRLWQAPTAGLAQGAFQDWLNSSLLQSGIAKPQISVTVLDDVTTETNASATSPGANKSSNATPTGLWKLNAKLNFEATTPQLLNLLNQLEGNEKQIIVATLNVHKDPTPRVDMELNAYFQKPGVAAQPSSKPASQ
jgi:hypothetical protein